MTTITSRSRVRVAITGAAGQIGYALLFRIASGQMFGPQVEVEMNLLELEQALPSLHGVAMELDDCAFPLLRKVTCTSSLKEGMDGVNWAVLVGSVPRKAGMERKDLLSINGKIFTEQGRAINNYAASDVRTFVVGNPCNTNCLIAMHSAPDVPNERFYAMTSLDELRARTQLAKKANIDDVTRISRMAIWGNHSSTQYPDFYNARIDGKPVIQVIQDENWLQNDFIECVQKRGAAVIQARGASSAASAANAAIAGVFSLIHDTPENEVFSVCKVSKGEYGIEPGLIFSFPCQVKNGQLSVVQGFEHNAFAQEKIRLTEKELKEERQAVTDLGLIEK